MNHTFRSADDVFRWMESFVNLERSRVARGLRLDRMEGLCALAGKPQFALPTIHVAGSKGKGSFAVMAASVLQEAGLKTALYLSPHVSDYRERIALSDGFFPEELYIKEGEELKVIAEEYLALHGRGEESEPSFFELATLYFFLCAREARCDAAVVETGMGGRLDATNVVLPEVSVIQPIELEHTEWLGDTLEKIAGEKAGIAKPGRPLISATQDERVMEVLRRAAETKGCPFYPLGELSELRNLSVDPEGTSFVLAFPGLPDGGPFGGELRLRLSMLGSVQARNAAAAALAVKLAFPVVDAGTLARGLARAVAPARFEKVMDRPPVLLDGAHTPASAALVVRTFRDLYGEGGVLLFGCAVDKDVRAMAAELAPHFSTVYATKPGSFKKCDLQSIRGAFEEAGHRSVIVIAATDEALREAIEEAKRRDLPLLVTGSFYLAAEARSRLLIQSR